MWVCYYNGDGLATAVTVSMVGSRPGDPAGLPRSIQGIGWMSRAQSTKDGMRPRSSVTCASPIRRTGTWRPSLLDRKSGVTGKSVSVRVELGGGRIINKKKKKHSK